MRKMNHVLFAAIAMMTAAVAMPAAANVDNPTIQNDRHATSFSWHTPANLYYAETVLTCTAKDTAEAVTKFTPVMGQNIWGLPLMYENVRPVVHFEFMQTKTNGFKVWNSMQEHQGEISYKAAYYSLDLGNGQHQLDTWRQSPVEYRLNITNPSGHISTTDIRGNVLFEGDNGGTDKLTPFRIHLPKRYGVNCNAF